MASSTAASATSASSTAGDAQIASGASSETATDIDAKLQALTGQLARILIEELLAEPRVGPVLSALEHGVRDAARPASRALAWRRQGLAALRDELVPLLNSLDPPPDKDAALLEQRHHSLAAHFETCGQSVQQTLEASAGALAAALAALDTQLTGLAEQVTHLPAVLAQAPRRTGAGRRARIVSAGVMLLALAAAAVVALHRFGGWPLRSAPTPWEQLWAQALTQPVLGCRENRAAQTFVACVCPSLSPATGHLGAQCQPEPGWPRHRLIGALEAVLRVQQPAVVWVDWEPGPELAQGLQNLKCDLTADAASARETLVAAAPADGASDGMTTQARDATLALLNYLEQHPACAD